jgi:trimethylamine---corrinoid protein Co-methyltransferase
MTADQLEQFHEKAMRVLEMNGMEVTNPEILDFFRARPGFRVNGTRLRFERSRVEECVAESRRLGARRKQDDTWRITMLSNYPTHLVDWRSGEMRPFLECDVVELTKLVDVLHSQNVRGAAAGVPQDVPPEIRDVRCYRIGAEYSRSGGEATISTAASAEWLFRMEELMGREKSMAVFLVSPMRAEGVTFDSLFQYRKELRHVEVGGMPMMGISSPVQFMGGFCMATAAIWGAYVMAHELTGLEQIDVECRLWPVDMRSAEIVYGTPDMLISDLILAQLRDFYGWEGLDCDAYHSSANLPDAQAMAQRAAYGMAMALLGRRDYRFGGLLGVDMVFSPVQLLMDLELLRYFQHVIEGFEFSDEAFCLDAIQEVGTSGSYLDHPSTLENFRKVLWTSKRWTSESLQRWLVSGQRTFEGLAKAEIERLIGQHEYHLPEDQARELDKLCRQAEASLLRG